MYALAVRLAFSDDAGGDLHACDSRFCLLFVSFQFVDHLFRNMDAGNVRVHVTAHTYRFRDYDTQLDRFAELFRFFHKLNEFLRLVYGLCLEVLGACGNLSLHLGELNVNGIAAGRNNRSFCEFRRLAHQLVSAQIHAGLQLFYRMDQRYGIQIKYGFRLRMISQLRMVSGKKQKILDSEHCGAQKIRFQSDTVPVAAGHLENRGQSLVFQSLADSQGTKTHN